MLAHPLGADRRVWAPVLDALAARRDVFAVDLPGFGASAPLDPDAGPPDPAALAQAVVRTLAAEGIERFHVAGNSLGGWVALEVACTGAALSVTAIAPAGLWPEPLMARRGVARAVASAALPVVGALMRTRRGRTLALAASVGHPERVPAADAAHIIRAYARAPGFDAVDEAMRSNRFLHLADVPVPMTLAWPQLDRLVARPRRLPAQARSVVLPDCGHIPMWDDPVLVARILLEGSDPEAG